MSAGRRAAAAAARVPWTLAYSGVILGTSTWLAAADGPARGRVLHSASTNLANLRSGHWAVLLTSAALVVQPVLPRLIGSAALLGLAELQLGSLRTSAAFLLGHVGASLGIFGLLDADALPGVASGAVATAVDVGTSYGTLAVLGALAAARAPRAAAGWSLLLLAAVGMVLLLDEPTFTGWGHLLAAAIGVGVGTALRPRGAPAGPGAAVQA